MASLSEFNPFAPETIEDPRAFWHALREEQPAYQIPGAGYFVISRYEDIFEVLHNEEVFSSNEPPGMQVALGPEVAEIMKQGYPPANTLLTNDPPSHTRFRALVNKAFSARRVAGMEPKVRTIANDLVNRFIADGRVELVSQFAVGLPLTVIADSLGVARDDMAKFKKWSDDSVAPLGGMISHERQIECAHSVVEFQHYFAARLEERRGAPRDDLLTDLVNARLAGVDPLNTAEMLSILQQLLVAGNETTTSLIASAMMILLRNPSQMAALAEDRSLIANFVEEALRLESPVSALFRLAKVDTEVGGVRIPAGSRLIVIYGSGNRDAAHFPNADRMDVRRDNARSHLAFGQGVHFCIGAALARLEGRVAFETLLARMKNIRFMPCRNDFAHTPSFILRGLKVLWLEFDIM
ncbi:MAG TPA: cytochrome P450 [Candidatus Binataceae bacterium]|nr:cytochrome P450 [Candidatus Binataceae bacterium]